MKLISKPILSLKGIEPVIKTKTETIKVFCEVELTMPDGFKLDLNQFKFKLVQGYVLKQKKKKKKVVRKAKIKKVDNSDKESLD